MTFRRPCMIQSWGELAVWLLIPSAIAWGCAVVVREPWPGPVVALATLAGLLGVLARKFLPRWRDVRAMAYRTRQGVGVVFISCPALPQVSVEAAIDRAVTAFGRVDALAGRALYVQSDPLYAAGRRVHGAVDLDMAVTWPAGQQTAATTLGLITHEASHVLLSALGVVGEAAQHARMDAAGVSG